MNTDNALINELARRVNRDFEIAVQNQDWTAMETTTELDRDCQFRFGATVWRFARNAAR